MNVTVNVFVPKDILRQSIVQDSIAQVMVKKTAPEDKTLFRKTVFGWKDKPTFKQKHTKTRGFMSEKIWADGEGLNSRGLAKWKQYAMINQGTKPHTFGTRGPGYPLKFRWAGQGSYTPSSRPRIIQSGRHSQKGGVVEIWSTVNHPGIEKPREFDKTIRDHYAPIFRKDIQDAIGVAAAKTAQSNN